MPYKDKNKAREAWKRWYQKSKENRDKKRKLRYYQYQAHKTNPIRQKCSIRECDNIGERHHPDYLKPKDIVWLCKKHHEQIHHTKVCKICGDKNRARELCNKHWKQWKKGKIII